MNTKKPTNASKHARAVARYPLPLLIKIHADLTRESRAYPDEEPHRWFLRDRLRAIRQRIAHLTGRARAPRTNHFTRPARRAA